MTRATDSPSREHTPAAPVAVILAAGKGTRMKSDLPKVVHPVGGRPMVCAVVDACLAAGCRRVIAVVGYHRGAVEAALAGYGPRVEFAVQDQQLGTGHAVMSAAPLLTAERATPGAEVLVLCGDGPLVRAETIRGLVAAHRRSEASATLATAEIDNPAGYGRIVRDAGGGFAGIVEERHATEAQRGIREVNPSYYAFEAAALFDALRRVNRQGASGEYYLTDTLAILLGDGRRVEVVSSVPPEDVLSINTPEDLARVDRIYRSRAGSNGADRAPPRSGVVSAGRGPGGPA